VISLSDIGELLEMFGCNMNEKLEGISGKKFVSFKEN
jgi:hypothetical protein